jgi:hypothetical protein
MPTAQIRGHVLGMVAAGAVLFSGTVLGQIPMFNATGGFMATEPTHIYAERSPQSKVLTTLQPLDVVEILARDDAEAAIHVQTHGGVEVEGWILKPGVVNMFQQHYRRAEVFAKIAQLQKWSDAATRLLVCLNGEIVIGSTSTEVGCALGLPSSTTEVETANGTGIIQLYDCPKHSPVRKCDANSERVLVTLIDDRVALITRQK